MRAARNSITSSVELRVPLFGDRSRNDDCAPGAQFRSWDNFLVDHILVMMSLCGIIRRFIGYIVCGDIGVYPLPNLPCPTYAGSSPDS
jgi:hypothetical protein